MYTRLTAIGLPRPAVMLHPSRPATAFPGAVTTTVPSMPAVLRPAFSSVTRRTLNNAFDLDRSISFCKLRTLTRSPACDAVKIR